MERLIRRQDETGPYCLQTEFDLQCPPEREGPEP